MSKLEVNLEEKIQVCPYRVSSQSSVVDDAEEFAELEDPCSQLSNILDDDEPETILEWYRLQSFTFGATTYRVVEELLTTVEQNPSANVELDLNRCGYTNLHVQIALDGLLRTRPECLTRLDLSRNRLLNPSLSRLLGNVLEELQTIAHLSLSYNTIDDECMKILSKALSNSGVRLLEVAHCQVTDRGGSFLFNALAYSDCIETIDASWNHLHIASGQAVGRFLSTQKSVQQLNLKGNQLYDEALCIIPLLLGTIDNETLQKLDLSWNGLRGEELGRALLKTIPKSHLKCLSLEHNLLTPLEMSFIARMMKKCETLEQLWLGSNMFEDTVMIDLVRTFAKHPSLQVISFGSFQFISQAVAKLCRLCKRKSPSKQIIYQGVIRANPARPVDVQEMLLERCRFLAQKPKKAKAKRDFGHLMLQLAVAEDTVLVREEFELAVKRFRVKLDRPLLEALMDAFEVPKKLVDTGAMALKYLNKHPTDPPIVKKAKKEKGKK
ncbi:uncharacterized protein LOC126557874 [Anopheles maculipalpis]|uniref:uncharacterized protein LOC126557874 n=1 Tax=Anopheles maculipalpis TaxID=1496333 RepID=UPI002159732F|nr:uncharacterized protein LOC126557874 [Anopheles maculipalpis]